MPHPSETIHCPYYSVVLPVFNEQDNLLPLFAELEVTLKTLKQSYEIICVDDGSTDHSLKLIQDYGKTRDAFIIIEFLQNRGQSAALWAGIRKAQGQYIITMDTDLQNDPADLVQMAQYLPEYDMINGWRHKRKDNLLTLLSSKIANFVRNNISKETIKDTGCSLKIMKASFLKRLMPFNGIHRFLPTLMKMEGAKVIEIPVNHRPRVAGISKYGITNRAIPAFIDLLAVRWMQIRKLSYEIKETHESKRNNNN